MAMNTKGYEKRKMKSVIAFFTFLKNHPTLSSLADEIIDPDDDGVQKEYRIIILIRGVKNRAKYDVINSAFMIAGLNLKMKGYEDVNFSDR